MNWLYRFMLGLPARPADVQEIEENFPEITDPSWEPDPELLEQYPYWRRRGFLDYPMLMLFTKGGREDLRTWIRRLERSQETARRGTSPDSERRASDCPAVDCPLRNSSQESTKPLASQTHVEYGEKGGFFVEKFMVAAGGPDRKPPKQEFMNLVRQVHKNMPGVSDVILTDPYLYSEIGEDGISGGLGNLFEYLDVLGLRQDSEFTLKTNPNIKIGSKETIALFQRAILRKFPHAKFETFSGKYVFHDRFYIVRDKNSQLRGIFGPSLNGLDSNSIVLMGEIEHGNALDRVSKWL